MRSSAVVPALLFALTFAVPTARADRAADPELAGVLARVAGHGARFEEMKRRGAYTLAGSMDELDGDGAVQGHKEMLARVIATETGRPLVDIVRYTEDGQDKTSEARKKQSEKKPSSGKRRDVKLPFLASEQPRYDFRVVARDPARPDVVRIAFSPKVPAEDALVGSAWVDAGAGEVRSMGFVFSKNPGLVDRVEVGVTFGLATPLGPAPSKITFDAQGGLLFIRKHYRGSAVISEPRLAR